MARGRVFQHYSPAFDSHLEKRERENGDPAGTSERAGAPGQRVSRGINRSSLSGSCRNNPADSCTIGFPGDLARQLRLSVILR